ncbi:hypothetical protein O6H91_Y252500 [Diphasiastrum complanatum]|nr:hypothetical protein O6H91_Y252500 [Diphasiastrum complanatum]
MVDSLVSSATIQRQTLDQECKIGSHAHSSQASAGRQGGLKISKESKRIKKIPQPLQLQPRPPLIIHTRSPKVIQAVSSDFMWLVQRLTGSAVTRLRCEKSKPSLPNQNDKAEAPPKSMPRSNSYDGSYCNSISETDSNSEAHSRSHWPDLEAEVSFCHTSKPSAKNHSVTEEPSTSIISLDDSALTMDFDSERNGAAPSMSDSWDGYETEAFVSSLPSPSIFSAIFLHELPTLSPTACSYVDFLDSSVAPNFQCIPLEDYKAW